MRLIKVEDRFPKDDVEVVVYFERDKDQCVHHPSKALMYRKYDTWNFVGSNTSYNGKYIKYWLDDSDIGCDQHED